MSRVRWAGLAALLLVLAVYGVYDWTRPCVGGPMHGFVKTIVSGGSYTVRCAG